VATLALPSLTGAGRTAIRLLPEAMGLYVAREIMNRQPRSAVSPDEHAAMQRARPLRYGARGRNVAWSWGEGPLVILVHGWGGRASQLSQLALHIAAQGFHAVAIDVTGHGESAGKRTRWGYFMRDIAALAQSLGEEVHAYVGHSSGGLSVMAARRLTGIHAARYVCVCSPSHPFKSVEFLRRRLEPSESTVARYRAYLARQFDTTWDELEAGWAFAGAGADTLLCYDETDRYIPHTEGDKILGLCHGARLVKTSGNGHNRILLTPGLAQSVGGFLAA
jgi:pimeloyl-ACP methyl ester carboxylesterase